MKSPCKVLVEELGCDRNNWLNPQVLDLLLVHAEQLGPRPAVVASTSNRPSLPSWMSFPWIYILLVFDPSCYCFLLLFQKVDSKDWDTNLCWWGMDQSSSSSWNFLFFFAIWCLPLSPALREQSRGFPHADLFLVGFSPKSLYSYVFMVLGFCYGLLLLNGPIYNFSYIPMYSWFWASLMGCCC